MTGLQIAFWLYSAPLNAIIKIFCMMAENCDPHNETSGWKQWRGQGVPPAYTELKASKSLKKQQTECPDTLRNQQVAYDKLSSMVTGTVYGEEAVAPYANGGGVYDCSFTGGLSTLEFDGANSAIKGYDAAGNEIFSHTYHYVGMEEIRGLYEYESDDADSGEFTYFCMAPDTNTTTYHIEFRYGSDLDALGQYDAGPYAYWLASGISTDYDQTMIENCIELFCTENLSA